MKEFPKAHLPKSAIVTGLIREPTVAFMLLAGLLFLANAVVSPEDFRDQTDRIEISQGRVIQLAEGYRLLTGSPPDPDELRNLIADFVDEEIAYREAVAMGLDRDDTVIRRRLRQKLEFIKLDTALVEPPTEEELGDWYEQNRDRYQIPERRALRIITFIEDYGSPALRAEAALSELRAGGDAYGLGDRSLLPSSLPLTTESGVARQFGDSLAAAAFTAPVRRWSGPFHSNYGAHLVYVHQTAAPHEPDFGRLRQKLLEDFTRAREAAALQRIWRQMRAQYTIVIDWPGSEQSASEPITPGTAR